MAATPRCGGRDPLAWGPAYYQRIGVSFELPNHYQKLTGLENLRFFASLYDGLTLDPMDLLDAVGLADDANTRVGKYSKGMQMRLTFAGSLINDPELLDLDEPTSGLDPVNARKVKNMIVDLKPRGRTVFRRPMTWRRPTNCVTECEHACPTSIRTVYLEPLDGRSAHPRLNVRGTRNADWGCRQNCGSKRAVDSHAEVRATQRRNGLRWSAHFDLRCSLAPKDVEEQFARRTAEPSRRLARSNRDPLVSSNPLNLEPASVKPPTQVVATATNVAPQGSIHFRREATGPKPVRSAKVLVVNKELVEIRQGADPFNAEEPDGRAGPDPRDEPCEVLVVGQSDPAPLGESLEGTR